MQHREFPAILIAGMTILLLVLIACSAQDPQTNYDVEAALTELRWAHERWRNFGSANYTVDLKTVFDHTFGKVRLTVKEGVVVSAIYISESNLGRGNRGDPVAEDDMDVVRTIDETFLYLRGRFRDGPPGSFRAEYYPHSSLWIPGEFLHRFLPITAEWWFPRPLQRLRTHKVLASADGREADIVACQL